MMRQDGLSDIGGAIKLNIPQLSLSSTGKAPSHIDYEKRIIGSLYVLSGAFKFKPEDGWCKFIGRKRS